MQARDALSQISKAFDRLVEVQSTHDESIKTTSANANIAAATIAQLRIEKATADSEIRTLQLRQEMRESDASLTKRDTIDQFTKVEKAIGPQEQVIKELKTDIVREEINAGRDSRGLWKKVNLGILPMENPPVGA